MSDPSPFYIARWIADGIRESDFITLQVAIENAIKENIPNISEEKATDLAEQNEHKVFDILGEIADNLNLTGTEPSFLLEGEPGTAYVKSLNIEAIDILSRLKQLSPNEFEDFCSNVLCCLGAKARSVGGSNDGGVDFIAYDVPIARLDIAALRASYPIVIGQAKRYTDKFISVTDLRSFVGAAVLRSDDIKRNYDRYGIFYPVIYAFWTTSDFHQSAREYSNKIGLWCLCGLSLAQLAIRIGLHNLLPQE
jgi:restriction endonuclease Mrr